MEEANFKSNWQLPRNTESQKNYSNQKNLPKMIIHRHTPVFAFTLLALLLVVILAQFLFIYERESKYQVKAKMSQRRLNQMEAVIEEGEAGYSIYVNDKFYDYKKY